MRASPTCARATASSPASAAACGRCARCRAGRRTAAPPPSWAWSVATRWRRPHGGVRAGVAFDATRLIRVPGSLTDEQAAMVEPATVALHAVHRTPPASATRWSCRGADRSGCSRCSAPGPPAPAALVAVEPDRHRRELALGSAPTTRSRPAEAADAVGAGADLVFECAGVRRPSRPPSTWSAGVARSTWSACAAGPPPSSPGRGCSRRSRSSRSLGYLHHEFAESMALIADGRVRVDPLHDRTVGAGRAAGRHRAAGRRPVERRQGAGRPDA